MKNTIDLSVASHSAPGHLASSRAAGARISGAWKAGVVLAALTLPLALNGCGNKGGATGGSGDAAVPAPDSALATVGDATIDRQQLYTLLEASSGEQALRRLIDVELVNQAAKADGQEVTEAELDTALAEQQKSDPALAQFMKKGGSQSETIRKSVRYQLTLNKLLTKDIKADPKVVETWLAKNRKLFDVPAQVKFGILLASTKKRIDVLAAQLKGGKTFLELVNEQKKTNDPVAAGSTNDSSEGTAASPSAGFVPIEQLGPLKDAVAKIQLNQTTGAVEIKGAGGVPGTPAAPSQFAIVRLIDRKEAVPAKATDPKIIDEWKLEQAARATAKQLSPSTPFETIVGQAQQNLMQQAMQSGRMGAPSRREAINLINQGATQKLLSDLRTKAKVTISDPTYATVAEAYKPAAAPPAPGSGAPMSGGPSGAAPSGAAPSSGAAPNSAPSDSAPPSSAPAAPGGAPATPGGAPATKPGG